MESLKLYWLGPPLVELRGRALRLETRKVVALLAYLSLTPGLGRRETLAAMFWPEANQKKALGNLRRTLASLKSDLPGWIEADRETITLKRNNRLWIDVEAFHQSLQDVRTHDHRGPGPCEACLDGLNEAVGYYRADLLDSLSVGDSLAFDEWQLFQRESLRREYAEALQSLCSGYAQRGDWETAILWARRWFALDRLHEPASRVLMDLYARSDQRSAALRHYEELSRLLQEQTGQEPEPETRELYVRLRGGVEVKQQPAQFSPFPILKTKLYIPTAPASRVVRSSLIECLREVEKKAVTIISAPAGFGKTSLLAEWIGRTSLPVAWLSLDKGDNDPYRFLGYLIAALESVHEGIGTEAQQLMQSASPMPPPIILASLINKLSSVPGPCALVLDDYQFISEPAVHEIVTYLLDHLPSSLHVVIATRADPPIRLGRLRAYGAMLELRTQDLRFTPGEAVEFLNAVMRLGLSAEEIDILEARTEGWVVGLQMAALSLKGRENAGEFIRAFSGSHRYVLDYLVEEVLKRQPAHIQAFLLETSILEKLSGPLCDALMSEGGRGAGAGSQDILEYLEQSNLFVIPLDDHKEWYRYHHLFADLLRSRLQQSSLECVLALHAGASHWFESHGFLNEAIEHALLSKDFERSANLLDGSSKTRVLINIFAVERWIEQIPAEILRSHPWIHVSQSWVLLSMGKLDRIERLLKQAEDCLEGQDASRMSGADAEDIRGHTAMIRAYLAFFRGQPRVTIEHATLALRNIRESNHYLRSRITLQLGESYSVLGELQEGIRYLYKAIELSTRQNDFSVATVAYFRLGNVLKVMGRLGEAEKTARQNIQALKDMGGYDSPMLGKPETALGDVLRERGELQAARELLVAGHKHSQLQGQPYDLVYSFMHMARLLEAEGNKEQAAEFLAQAEPLFVAYSNPPAVRLTFDACQVALWLRLGRVEQALDWAARQHLDASLPVTYASEPQLIPVARLLLAQRRLDEARELLERLAAAAVQAGRNGRLMEVLILQALTLQARGDPASALGALSRALELAQPEGYMRLFLDEGQPLIELLEALAASASDLKLKDYVNRLLDASAVTA